MMRDFNTYSVRRASRCLVWLGGKSRSACGSMVKAVKKTFVYRGDCFCNDIEMSLPYVGTVTLYNGCQDISMDEDYLVVEVCTAV